MKEETNSKKLSIELLYKQMEEMRKELKNQDMYIDKLKLEYDKEIERLNNIIDKALGIANERVNYYSNHKNNNQEHLEDWENIFNVLLRRDNE